ncbi:MAG: glycosyltransferase family 9 protein [Desulfovibrionaceae bacterium]|nr:glycosyltransferase family 9 protein [Desulfovibrionaceae bacterium]
MHLSPAPETWLAFRLSALGDVVLTTGVLEYWRRKNRRFVFVTREALAPILEGHPAIIKTVGLKDHELRGPAWLGLARGLADEYQGLGLLDLHGSLRSRVLALVWKGEVRRYPKHGLARRLFLHTKSPALKRLLEQACVTQRYAMALEQTPPPAGELLPLIRLTPAEQDRAAKDLAGTGRPLVALHPYATHPDKAWPRGHWLALAELLAGRGLAWFVVGRDPAPLFPDHPLDFTNKCELRRTAALLSLASVLVTNDSGPMHLASAVGAPVVGLFGPTCRAWGFYPAGPRDRVLEQDLDCRPCSLHGKSRCQRERRCLSSTSPQMVLEAVEEVLFSGPGPGAH